MALQVRARHERCKFGTKFATQGNNMAQRPRKTTTDHEEIRTWAIARGGYPVMVPYNEESDTIKGDVLRIAFEDEEEDYERIDWSDFFTRFDAEELALIYEHDDSDEEACRRHELCHRSEIESQRPESR